MLKLADNLPFDGTDQIKVVDDDGGGGGGGDKDSCVALLNKLALVQK